MENISIRLKIHGLFIAVIVIMATWTGYTLLDINRHTAELKVKTAAIEKIASLSQDATITLKKQVQEWKDILIRGHEKENYDKYAKQFEEKRKLTQDKVKQLASLAIEYPEMKQQAEQFLTEHDELTKKYYDAIPLLFENSEGLGYRDVDKKVKGMDRPPTQTLEKIAEMAEKTKIAVNQQADESINALVTQFMYMAVSALIFAVLGFVVTAELSVLRPIQYLTNVVNAVLNGELDARAQMSSGDEIGTLGDAFDNMLEDKLSLIEKSDIERKKLNNSIIELLKSVAQLSQKDLTVKIPVSDDVTGTLSDSINLLTQETAGTLRKVVDTAVRVNMTSTEVKNQAEMVIEFAELERMQTGMMLEELETAVVSMSNVSVITETTNQSSEEAMKATDNALASVTEVVQSITKIREIIRETEKRIKRLGERSQEITGVVSIINEIAERTHVLALNAGMQAAQAGDAGRGFMVVANEVQRLAENSREATGQISALVKNIQVDTNDTINVMNEVITNVVDGTKLAEDAGNKMKETRSTTQELVEFVHQIAEKVGEQVELSKTLKERAISIQDSTDKTHIQLQEQKTLSDVLQEDAEKLVKNVNIFKLPQGSAG